ncbi:FadR/GntR family transcriptional regulator [Oceanobacillus bengalensis]|uniref:FadR family transcriptional regulator n=1 Tax=Oceanobacillus bengalensis TaxID=1435466 RepID=A0A494YZF8_9BACI|nr:FadR/GntR family transcriptional regulator [Oceanobacillus bengalensis]RKQ15542.1 FadR family transcriptional regulator [Oceanobacillus bengalensis]
MEEESLFTSIKTERMYEVIVSQIHELIKAGKLKPGDRLPSERKLAESLECSRSSLREAFRVLESDGLIISKAGGGRFVQTVNGNMKLDFDFNSVNVLEKSALLHFLEAREVLEPKIVELAIQRASDEQLEKLARVLENMDKDLRNPVENIDNDSIFHLGLAELTGNFVFVSMMETNLNMIKKMRKKVLTSPDRHHYAMEEHKQIFEAIKRGDTVVAVERTLHHLQNLRKNIMQNY